ncbi:glycosyltransferase, partial [Paenibacillus sp. TAF58]
STLHHATDITIVSRCHMRSSYAAIIEHLQQQHFKEAEVEAKDLVRSNPLEAQAWVFLGESLMRQGYGLTAKRVFNRAWLLDPEAAWVKSVYEALEHTTDGEERVDIEGMLHVPKVTVAAAILARNEEQRIEACITALYEAVDEIILVDSSTDRTQEIAAKFSKVKIVSIEWSDHFAAARNEGLKHIQSDWVLWADTDELLLEEDVTGIREIAGIFHHHPTPPVLHIWHLNQIRGEVHHDFSQTRMFPMKRGLQFWGRIHEQISGVLGIYQEETYRRAVRIRFLHDGYDPSVIKEKNKLERNLRLLKMMIEEEPNDPGNWLYYGRESLLAGQDEQAQKALFEAERLGLQTPRFGRMLDVYKLLTHYYMSRREWAQAESNCSKALELNDQFPDAHFLLAQIRMKQADELYMQADFHLKKAKTSFKEYRGSVSADYQIGQWKADLAVADLALRAGKLAEARHIYHVQAKRYPNIESLSQRMGMIEKQRQLLNRPI